MSQPAKSPSSNAEMHPPLPVEPEHWLAIVRELELSPRQARIVELLLRGLGLKEIASDMGLCEPTVKTYLGRVFAKTRTGGRMELALKVLETSHAIDLAGRRHPKG